MKGGTSMVNKKGKSMFTKLKGMPIKKATSFEPSEIKGTKPDIKLDGHNLETATATYKG